MSIYSNLIEELGENSFEFDEPPAGVLNQALNIYLHGNRNLTENSFHPNSGLDRIKRRVSLDLEYTGISSLPAPIFETFLDAHPGNSMDLLSTPLICDGRVKWLKDRRAEFENLVPYASCANDPGQTIFNSTLVG